MLKIPTQSTIDRNILQCDMRITELHKIAPSDWMIALLEMVKRSNILAGEVLAAKNV